MTEHDLAMLREYKSISYRSMGREEDARHLLGRTGTVLRQQVAEGEESVTP